MKKENPQLIIEDDEEFEKSLDRAFAQISESKTFAAEIRERHFSAGVPICYLSGKEPKGFFTQEYPDGKIEYIPL